MSLRPSLTGRVCGSNQNCVHSNIQAGRQPGSLAERPGEERDDGLDFEACRFIHARTLHRSAPLCLQWALKASARLPCPPSFSSLPAAAQTGCDQSPFPKEKRCSAWDAR